MTEARMSHLAVVGATLPPALDAVLRDRRRTYEVRTGVAEHPSSGLRGALVGPDTPPDVARSLVRHCLEEDVPLLAFGAPAVASLRVAPPPPGPLVLRRARLTDAGREDPVTAATMAGAPVLVSDDVPDGAEDAEPLLVDDDGKLLLARRGPAYLTVWRLDVGVSSAPDIAVDASFIVPHAAALLGRWIDRAVGREDAEKPWGRRGPGPVPAPGLLLNPA
jgi:hypothetical protein